MLKSILAICLNVMPAFFNCHEHDWLWHVANGLMFTIHLYHHLDNIFMKFILLPMYKLNPTSLVTLIMYACYSTILLQWIHAALVNRITFLCRKLVTYIILCAWLDKWRPMKSKWSPYRNSQDGLWVSDFQYSQQLLCSCTNTALCNLRWNNISRTLLIQIKHACTHDRCELTPESVAIGDNKDHNYAMQHWIQSSKICVQHTTGKYIINAIL